MKAALEELPVLDLVDVAYEDASLGLCDETGAQAARITLQHVRGLVTQEPAALQASTASLAGGGSVSIERDGLSGGEAALSASGSYTAVAFRGRASFRRVTVDRACKDLTLEFSVAGVPGAPRAQSAAFSTWPGAAAALELVQAPEVCAAGVACRQQPMVRAVDLGGNPSAYEEFAVSVAVAAASDARNVNDSASLLGSAALNTSAGEADFADAGLGLQQPSTDVVLAFAASPPLLKRANTATPPFDVSGVPASLRFRAHPPARVANGTGFDVSLEVLDANGVRLAGDWPAANVTVALHENPSCPVACATLVGSEPLRVLDGVARARGLALHSSDPRDVFTAPAFRVWTESEESSVDGTFRLALDLSGSGASRVVTRPIATDAPAAIEDEGTVGESVQARLEALPGVGAVSAQRVVLDASTDRYGWDVVLQEWRGELPLPLPLERDVSGTSAHTRVQWLRPARAFRLRAEMVDERGGKSHPLVAYSRGFELVPPA